MMTKEPDELTILTKEIGSEDQLARGKNGCSLQMEHYCKSQREGNSRFSLTPAEQQTLLCSKSTGTLLKNYLLIHSKKNQIS